MTTTDEVAEHLKAWLTEDAPLYAPVRHVEGTYGLVVIMNARTEHVVPKSTCVKTLNPAKIRPDTRDLKELFEREMRTWLAVPPHPHVLPALGLDFVPVPLELGFGVETLPLVRMPFCDSALAEWVAAPAAVTIVDRLIALAQVCCGLQWLYEHGIQGHGDLKPDNILLTDLTKTFAFPESSGYPSKSHPWSARVADLGWADIWCEGGGTYHAWRPYLAPERHRGSFVAESSDMFAVGVMACELLTGKHPAGHSTKELARKWNQRKWMEWTATGTRTVEPALPHGLGDIVSQLLAPDHELRPSAQAVKTSLCHVLEEHYGIDLLMLLEFQDARSRKTAGAATDVWAATEMARVSDTQRDSSIARLESQAIDPFTPDGIAGWLVRARVLQRLLRRRGTPSDAERIAQLALGSLAHLRENPTIRLTKEVYGPDMERIIPDTEMIRAFAGEALRNLEELGRSGDDEALQDYSKFFRLS